MICRLGRLKPVIGRRALSGGLKAPDAIQGDTKVLEAFGEEFRCELLDGEDKGIAVFTMQREKSKNALGKAMMKEMREALDRARLDNAIRAVILHSNVDRVFCAGADLKERAQMNEMEVAAFVHGLRSSFEALSQLPVPTIAAIEGAALGGGLELAMSCDIRVAGANSLLGLPETGLAIIPGAGGTQRLPRLVGPALAKELIFTGRRLSAQEAAAIGMVNYAVEASTAFGVARALARSTLDKGPIALRAAKTAIDRGMDGALALGMAIEQACYAQVIPTKDRLEGLQAFREKRKPEYKGH